MGSLVSLALLLIPAALVRWFSKHSRSDEPDVLYPLSIFFGVGIWIVIRRYQNIRDRARNFKHPKPVPDAAELTYQAPVIPNPSLHSHKSDPDLLPPFQPTDREFITCYDPATGMHIDTIMADNAADINAKITRASVAQKEWKKTTLAQRRRVVRSLKKWLVENQDTCARVACRDTGKTMLDAALGEILTTCSKMDWLIKHGERVLRPDSRYPNMMLLYKKSRVYYEPLGVVAALVSWNYPLHNALSPIMASIFAGNGVVLKCSEHVVWSTTWFIGAVKECLRACGHDPDLVQLVRCYPDEAEALTTSPMIKHITFIGSERVGRLVAQAATEHLTPVTLELGGKDPCIIMKNTDLNKWISLWMRGVFQNAGQNCIGIERLIVHSSQHDELYEMLVERVEKLRAGSVLARTQEGYISTVDTGSMINGDRFAELERMIADAENNGARVVGGKAYSHPYHRDGSYFAPTVIGDVDPNSEIAHTELFAPVALLIQYETVDEAVEIANNTRYGLGASIFGMDQDECLKVAKRLECGMVSINDFGVFYVSQDLPFGGTKASGYGRFGGPEGLRSLTNPKAIMTDRLPWLIQTSIPAPLDYPVRSLVQSWEFVSGLISFLYADGWRASFNGLGKLIGASGGARRPTTTEAF
ncbi:Aldedh-domain-containing protein [Punctularia strigosozonata HHB-11173 SS5]|uniref:Aldedh-domain-containing protein n=1 Tax=Punctularia strigosozonata (strain HHB-11173) TaxID=741275 RepID=UPI00044163A3|nr:Aldedh-domain-containing protein [Punctularia strigosozonata HHB-11173 SS5]EIN13899.1 Aldedh-domain-containing protein [Punctularia strigosozonata HHB-11173 SS5]